MRYFWELTTSELSRVYQELHKAIEQGIVIPKGCEFPSCNVAKGLNVVSHHEDYDKPTEVVWLCRKHHRQRYAVINKIKPKTPSKKPTKSIPLSQWKIKPWGNNYQDKEKFKFMAHWPDSCYCKPCTLARKEKAWQNA